MIRGRGLLPSSRLLRLPPSLPFPMRLSPYDAILEPLEASAWPAIRDEAEQRGIDTRRRDRFVLLGNAGAALKDMIPDDAPPEAVEQYADLLYHGYQFWLFGKHTFQLDASATERITAPSYEFGDWRFAAPPSAYLQFPDQRIWARVAGDAPYEPADGCFVIADGTEPAPDAGMHLRAQLVLGLRADRAGVSLVSYCTDFDPGKVASLAERPWREDAEPFANTIPGGDRRGFRTVATTSELEALVIRALREIDQGSGSREDGGGRREEESEKG